jgi:type IV secretion system protein VirB5
MPRRMFISAPLRTLTLASVLALCSPFVTNPPVLAQGVPVVDTQNIAQNIQQLRQMIEDELNGLLDQEFGDIIATIEAIKTGDFSGLTGSGASEIETQMDRVLADLGFDEDTLSEMARSGNPGAERVATQATTGALVSAAAQNSYEDAGQSLERVDRLVGLIDDMDELKESVDLNTRVTAELAIALVAMWQLEAIQTVGDGTGGVIDAATIAEEQRFMEFTLPELNAD